MTNVFGRHQSGTCTYCHSSRRGFIEGAAALGVAAALFAKPSAAAPSTMLIDTHHHFFPPAYQKAWLEWEEARQVPHFPSQVAWSKGKAIEAMDEAGIRTAVLSIASTPGSGSISMPRGPAKWPVTAMIMRPNGCARSPAALTCSRRCR
jgi:hypothetical protein